jgi:hypothetical protein
MLSTLPKLRHLDIGLRDSRIGYQGPSGLGSLKSLESLHISRGDPLSDADLAALESLTGLKKLLISCPAVGDRGLTSIGKLSQLEDLTLMTDVTRTGLNQLNGLSKLYHLQVNCVNMPGEVIPSEETTLDLSGLRSMKDMNLTGVPLDDEDYAFLGHLSSLKVLMIQPPSPLEGKSLRHLRNLPELSRLWLSNLANCSGGNLALLDGLPKLKDLSVYGDLPDATLKALAGPAGLRSLDVRTNAPIRKETVTDLAARLPQLEYVHISESPPWVTRPRETGKSTGPDPARPNRRTPAGARRGGRRSP